MSKFKSETTHKADATALLDDRGYSGLLIRGQNPALLFEKAVRDRITESYYWKEQCFGLNAATLCDRAAELTAIGGTYGGTGRPTPFLCLAFKLLQLVPEKAVVLEYLNFHGDEEGDEDGGAEGDEESGAVQDPQASGKRGEFKYLRALAAFYIRLAWEPVEIYTTLEPLLADFRKLRRRTREGFALTYVDQFVDDLLSKDRMCATSLWKLPSRANLEDLELLEPRVSPLGNEIEELDREDEVMEEGSDGEVVEARNGGRRGSSERSRSRERYRSSERSRSGDRYGSSERSRNGSRRRYSSSGRGDN
jgi:pre-mRNA-splicing factor 38A